MKQPAYTPEDAAKELRGMWLHDKDFHGFCHSFLMLGPNQILRTDGEKFWVTDGPRIGTYFHSADECPN